MSAALYYHYTLKQQQEKEARQNNYRKGREPTFEELTSPEVMKRFAKIKRSREYKEKTERINEDYLKATTFTAEDFMIRFNAR